MKTKIIRNKTADEKKPTLSKVEIQKPSLVSQSVTKKNNMIQKLNLHLKNKFLKLMKDKEYSEKNLNADLSLLLNSLNYKNLEYNTLLLQIEKYILDILNKKETKTVQGLPNMTQINSLINSEVDPNKKKEISINKINTINRVLDEFDWASKAKNDYQEHLEEIQKKKFIEIEKKQMQKSFLEEQIKQKENLKLKDKEELKKFHLNQINKIKQEDKEEESKSKDLQRKKINEMTEVNKSLLKDNTKRIIHKEIAQDRYIKEQEDEYKKLKETDAIEKTKKLKELEDMKMVLKIQILEKQKREEQNKKLDQKYIHEINLNVEDYNRQMKRNGKNQIEQKINYKRDLDNQLKRRSEIFN